MYKLLTQLDIDLSLKIVLAIIMLGVGLSLKVGNFVYLRNNKRLLAIGLFFKLIFLPLLAFFILSFTSLSPFFKLGILILFFTPGGTTTNVITYWFKGTAALTIFLTVLSSLVNMFSIPVLVNVFSLYYFGEQSVFTLPIGETIANILLIILLPALIGLWIHEQYPKMAVVLERWIKPSSVILLALVYLIKFFAPADAGGTAITMAEIMALLPVLLLINILGMLIGYWIARKINVNTKDSMTIGIEMGVQNASLAILVGSVFLQNEDFIKPALVYAMFSFWTTVAFAYGVSRKRG